MSSFAAMWSPLLFGFALFLGSALLFVVQPMLGRTLLPHLGGNPIAWNACLVFFQATLLAGYLYANLLHRFRGLRWQPVLQLLFMAFALALLFAGIFGDGLLLELAPRLDSLDSWPILSTLCLLIVVIGLPYLALAAVSPLVQRWFAQLDHPKASDPYFLFVASNLGGLFALVIYPLLIEPSAPLAAQWLSWKLALAGLGVLLFLLAFCAWLSPRNPEFEPPPPPSDPNAPLVPKLIGRGPATVSRRLYWLFASALPVGLLMGATDYLTLDVAPAPILWMLPLALYLLAFSQAFSRFSPLDLGGYGYKLTVQIIFGIIAGATAVIVILVLMSVPQGPRDEGPIMLMSCVFFLMLLLTPFNWLWVVQPLSAIAVILVQVHLFKRSLISPAMIVLYMTSYYLSVRLCLGMLAKDRPAAPALTTYYSWMAIGGLCGGLFQLIAAPFLFRRDYLEYSLLAALACTLREAWVPHGLSDWLLCMLLFRKRKEAPASPWPGWIALAFDLGIAAVFSLFAAYLFCVRSEVQLPNAQPGGPPFAMELRTLFADFPLILALLFVLLLAVRPLRFGLALTAIVALSWIGRDGNHVFDPAIRGETVLVQQRTPFGILRVTESEKPFFQPGGGDPLRPQGLRTFKERQLMHATTNHGACITEPNDLLRFPTTYYHRKGPVGMVMNKLAWFSKATPDLRNAAGEVWLQRNRDNAKDDVRLAASLVGLCGGDSTVINQEVLAAAWSEPPFAVIGLGTGTQFVYGHPYQTIDAYELDPAIIELSTRRDGGIFHYYQSALKRGVNASIIPGDARRSLSKSGRDGFYHVIFVDAFNSDAIPVHLLTQEAIELYFQKLAPDGVICIHTSNRYLDLPRVLSNVARKLDVSIVALNNSPDIRKQGQEHELYRFTSEWVVLARNAQILQRWTQMDAFPLQARQPDGGFSSKLLWTDERSSVLTAARQGAAWPTLIYALLVLILFFGIFLGMIEIGWAMTAQRPPKPPGEARRGR